MNKERPRKEHDTTPCPYLRQADRPSKGSSKGGQSSSPRGKINFQKREEWKDVIPVDVGTSTNPFQSTDEELESCWEDILSDCLPYASEESDSSPEIIDLNCFPYTSEENYSNPEIIDLISLPGTDIAEHSSTEIMRCEEGNFSEEISSPIEYPRKTLDWEESDSNFIPKLASTQLDCSFDENSRIFGRSVHQSTKLGISLENKGRTANAPDISNFADSLENENSLPSTINAPEIFNFEEVKEEKDALVVETTPTGFENVLHFFKKGTENPETSFITTINTEDVVDSVFKHSDEPNSPNFDDALVTDEGSDSAEGQQSTLVIDVRRSLNGTLINSPQTEINTRKFFLSDSSNKWFSRRRPTKGREKVSPRQLFTHSKLSSGELDSSIIRQSSRRKGGRPKKKSIPIFPPNPPKATSYSGTSNQDPYAFPSDESSLDAEVSVPRNTHASVAGNLKARKKTPGAKSRSGRKKKSPVKWSPLSLKEVQEYAEYLKTIPICPLSLPNTCSARIDEDKKSDEY